MCLKLCKMLLWNIFLKHYELVKNVTLMSRSASYSSQTYTYCIYTGFKFILLWLLHQHGAWHCDSHIQSWLSCDIECPSHFVHNDPELLLNSHWNDCTVPPNREHQITLPKEGKNPLFISQFVQKVSVENCVLHY